MQNRAFLPTRLSTGGKPRPRLVHASVARGITKQGILFLCRMAFPALKKMKNNFSKKICFRFFMLPFFLHIKFVSNTKKKINNKEKEI